MSYFVFVAQNVCILLNVHDSCLCDLESTKVNGYILTYFPILGQFVIFPSYFGHILKFFEILNFKCYFFLQRFIVFKAKILFICFIFETKISKTVCTNLKIFLVSNFLRTERILRIIIVIT